MQKLRGSASSLRSPSVWREWIEINCVYISDRYRLSPSVWREWIEISIDIDAKCEYNVSLRVEGVD